MKQLLYMMWSCHFGYPNIVCLGPLEMSSHKSCLLNCWVWLRLCKHSFQSGNLGSIGALLDQLAQWRCTTDDAWKGKQMCWHVGLFSFILLCFISVISFLRVFQNIQMGPTYEGSPSRWDQGIYQLQPLCKDWWCLSLCWSASFPRGLRHPFGRISGVADLQSWDFGTFDDLQHRKGRFRTARSFPSPHLPEKNTFFFHTLLKSHWKTVADVAAHFF